MVSAAKKKSSSASTSEVLTSKSKLDDDILVPVEKSNSAIDLRKESQYRVVCGILTVIAFFTRYYSISYPNEVVFDEVHFGKFAAYYIERTYFFDLHPPFAKLLIAAIGYLVGFNGKFKFDNIGDNYVTNNVPYIPLRCLSAVLGTLTVPVMFNTMKECGYSVQTCAFAACLVLFDNAHVAETRLILLDATLILSVALSLFCYVKFTKQRNSPFKLQWWKWLIATGISLSCVISTKYVGVFTFFTIGFAVLVDLWALLDYKKGLTIKQFYRHFISRFISLLVLPFIIYLSWFYVHFAILTKSGPGDAFMSPEFQETLGDSPLAREAKAVNYYDIITIKHKDTQAYLHSHHYHYPLRYEDGRVSSQGQQVTAFEGEDMYNNWEILPVKEYDENDKLNHAVRQSDVIRLKHVGTGGYLLTHDVASPLFPTNEEFVVINPELGDNERFNDTLFKLDPFDKKKGSILKTKASLIKFLHVPTMVAMWTHNDELLPDWGFHQQEVNGNKNVQSSENIWFIEEIVDLSDERKAYVPKSIKTLPFLAKWLELQKQMFEQNNKLTSDHPFASEPGTWPFSLSGVSFWTNDNERKQIFFIGNITGFWIEVSFLCCYIGLVLGDQLTRQRNVKLLNDKSRSRLYNTLGFFFMGWCLHYLPFFLMSRQKFLHHYLPAHLIAALFSGGLLEFMFTDNRADSLKSKEEITERKQKGGQNSVNSTLLTPLIVLLLSVLIWNFIYFAPITYGNTTLSVPEVQARQWLGMKLHFAK
ncbi:hypothetical protein PACTADRAFT_50632 [Pachysolen tannophilus NRRL Y-2460]|uniref:Dolichyl-phosphate-mannose--protein mannosyltransferase n=1 Tax=Pachysolen tannophilus NRRL Y-2460 TaxID=669874 RepID=A0A1E4TSP3_PACTA|nr:hypothetical protein PACTADRAFT_50632 [Pachysolen tannophilus NRRL Y-2460]